MPAAEVVQTFAGISNENEFYSHHYLANVFNGDIRERVAAWAAAEEAAPEQPRSPVKRLAAQAQPWFARLAGVARGRGAVAERLAAHRELHAGLLGALAYAPQPTVHEHVPGLLVPVWQLIGEAGRAPQLVIVPAYVPGNEDADALDQPLTAEHYAGVPVPPALAGVSMAEVVSDALFGADDPPRWVLLVGLDEWLLLDRLKWPNNRLLRFDWSEILDRKDTPTLQAAAALLHRESLAPATGAASLLDSLDEKAHQHAAGVSEDLKYAIREAIELLGNEAVRKLNELAVEQRRSLYSGRSELDPARLSLECLRLVYRLLFMFYIEARPELGYVPIAKSKVYLEGYSLESLRELEAVSLTTEQSRSGSYFDRTLRRLFSLVAQGCGPTQQPALAAGSVKDVFALAPLDSRLFDPDATPLLNRVVFRNEVWQRVIRLMSRSGGGRGRRPRRVSYQLLSINQLGAVYEALLSYRGFFAAEDLFEVRPAANGSAAAAQADDETGDDDADDDSDEAGAGAEGAGRATDVMDSAWFVPESRIRDYRREEIVHDVDDEGRQRMRRYPRGSFIYRLAGRDRQKSASYYTPQVLTRCLVKYALKELLQGKGADDILALSVVEPAMGSAAFLNEAVNQLAEAYLERKQTELQRRIPHERYATELQKVRMYIADRNVFGVDLNPVAVELAEVSLWLNAIYGEDAGDDGGRPKPARVPWFGYQLFAGNSLVGARREVYRAHQLLDDAAVPWHEEAPRRIDPLHSVRADDEVYHFLLPDPGMAGYTDKVAKSLYPEQFTRIAKWRKEIKRPLAEHEVGRLQQLSAQIDALWAEHTAALARDRAATEDPLSIWPHEHRDERRPLTRAEKEAARRRGLLNDDGDLATPYRRLKLVMDYWCALWFWPIAAADELPSREEWWLQVGAILEGNIVEIEPQAALDLGGAAGGEGGEAADEALVPEPQSALFREGPGAAVQPPLAAAAPRLHDRYGHLRISRLRDAFAGIARVEVIADVRRFFHWELAFADVFYARRGGFDLVLGNPPWLKVEWDESGVLGERNPLFDVRDLSATERALQRAQAFAQFDGLQADWTAELEGAQGSQSFLNAVQTYPLLQGAKVNLYKCFITRSWQQTSPAGVASFLHQESPYDDPKGGALREAMYGRLRAHYQFVNELQLFSQIDHHTKFSLNVYGAQQPHVGFDHIANLFAPATVDACHAHEGGGLVGGYKNDAGEWNTAGHRDRLLRIGDDELATFAKLYDAPGTPARRAKLPALHAGLLSTVLHKLSAWPRRLADLRADAYSTMLWNEKLQQDDGTITRSANRSATFAANMADWVLSGPHFFIANPFSKTPRRRCARNGDYDVIDLEAIGDDYLPRTNYRPMSDRAAYLRRIPRVSWVATGESIARPITQVARLAVRRGAHPADERSVRPILLPQGAGHIDRVFAVAFAKPGDAVTTAGLWSSLVLDFLHRTTGKKDFRDATATVFPVACSDMPELVLRVLALNCLTAHFAPIWSDSFDPRFIEVTWSQPVNPRLPQDFFSRLIPNWQRHCALRTDYARRMALLEIDVLVAQALGLTLDELLLIYRVQFPVLQGYERDTWYDIHGRTVFTNRKGSNCLPRTAGRNSPETQITWPNGRIVRGRHGWNDVSDLPDGAIVQQWVMDDTLPGGPHRKERRWVAPFALADREADYEIAWAFFDEQRRLGAEGGARCAR